MGNGSHPVSREKAAQTNSKIQPGVASACSRNTPPRKGRKKRACIASEKPYACKASPVERERAPTVAQRRCSNASHRRPSILNLSAKGITHPMKLPGLANERAGIEGLQLQRGIVQRRARFRVSGQEDLEPAIKLESLNAIRSDSPAHIVRALKDRARDARLRQATRTGKPRETSTDNQHSRGGGHHRMTVIGRMRKWNHAILTGTARVFSLSLAAGRRAQAVHLNRVAERGGTQAGTGGPCGERRSRNSLIFQRYSEILIYCWKTALSCSND